MLIKRLKGLGLMRVFSFCAALIISSALLLEAAAPVFAVGQLTARSATLSTSLGAATGVTYTLNFTTGSTATIQSLSAQACDTASGSCTQSASASGFSASSSTLASSQGLSGTWTVNTGTANTLKGTASGASSTSSGTAKTMTFGGVTNPTATNSTFYLRITTYSDASYTTVVDTGTVAVSTAGQITVTASVNESLTFTLTTATVALGTLTTSSTGSGTSSMSASTNANTGYAITVNGNTLTSGSNPILAMPHGVSPNGSTASQGSSQFGINLVSNTSPSVSGSAGPSGGTGAASNFYNTTNTFSFVTGDTVAAASGASNTTTYTVSYIGNISPTTQAGSYSTVLTYICTPTF